MQRLPDAEFEVMKAVWNTSPPISVNMVVNKLNGEKAWKVQTVISLMLRLIERGFLETKKNGKDRVYFPLISKEEYLKAETDAFVRQYHDNSVFSVFNSLYNVREISEDEIAELLKLIKWTEGK